MLKKLNKDKKIQVVFKLQNPYKATLETFKIGEVDTVEEAFDMMNNHIEENSTINRAPYIRYHINEDILVIDYGAHNAHYTFSNIAGEMCQLPPTEVSGL